MNMRKLSLTAMLFAASVGMMNAQTEKRQEVSRCIARRT